MTEKEAIKRVKEFGLHHAIGDLPNSALTVKSFEMAISALERQEPKEIDFEMNLGDYTSRFICKCGNQIIVKHGCGVMDNHNAPNYCSNCGQALKWSDDDD